MFILFLAPAAALERGIVTSNPNAVTVLHVMENTSTVHNVIVCTLCSCYPIGPHPGTNLVPIAAA